MKDQLCLRCLGTGAIFIAPVSGRREPVTYLSPKARQRLADSRQSCDGCGGTGTAASDIPMLEFLATIVVNSLGMFSHERLDDEQRERLDVAYNTAWAVWHYYHQNGNPDPLIREALESAVSHGRNRLGWYPYGEAPDDVAHDLEREAGVE